MYTKTCIKIPDNKCDLSFKNIPVFGDSVSLPQSGSLVCAALWCWHTFIYQFGLKVAVLSVI